MVDASNNNYDNVCIMGLVVIQLMTVVYMRRSSPGSAKMDDDIKYHQNHLLCCVINKFCI